MKVSLIPAAIANFTIDAMNTLRQLRHKAVQGRSVVSAASQPKPYNCDSLLKRDIKVANSTTGMVNQRANQRVLGELKAFLLEAVKASAAPETTEAELEMTVDLALAKTGLAKITHQGLKPRHIRNEKITENQLLRVQEQLKAIQENPMQCLEEALTPEPLPSNFVLGFIRQHGNQHTVGKYQGAIVLGDWMIVSSRVPYSGEMSLSDFNALKEAAKNTRASRLPAPPEIFHYIDQIEALVKDTSDELTMSEFRRHCNNAIKYNTALLPRVVNLARETSSSLPLQATLNVLAECIDYRREVKPDEGKGQSKPDN